MLHDEVTIRLSAGKGGDGSVSLRREKYIPKGGPDGGDGGRGGDVIIQADPHLSDLSKYASLNELKAENGMYGMGKKLYGRAGEDLIVPVPLGTQVYRQYGSRWKLVKDFQSPNDAITVLKGGDGGLGNVHFATATHQTPRYAQPGTPGEQAVYKFELQLIADVGLIGFPNAGKSTLISTVTEAKPKIANYPFTTLSPVLGVVQYHDRSFIMADIPGLIEGASEGKGLGLTFLRHVKRTGILIHMIDSLSDDYARDYQVLRKELGNYANELVTKPELVVISKGELITEDMLKDYDAKIQALKQVIHAPSQLFSKQRISAASRLNVQEFLNECVLLLDKRTPA
jgi:GTP-binding protein